MGIKKNFKGAIKIFSKEPIAPFENFFSKGAIFHR